MMMRRLTFILSVALVSAAWISAAEMGKSKTKEMVWPAGQIQFQPTPMAGISQAVLWGNPQKGSYGAITKFAPGTKNALHTHSNDIKIVVISGEFVYGRDGKEQTLGAGSYLLIPGGTPHTSGSGAGTEGIFFEEGSGKFDMIPVQK